MKTIRVVAAVIKAVNENGEIIIFATQRGYGDLKGGWEFPGGKIEEGETSQEALKREIMEELETEIAVGELIDTIEYDYPTFHLSMDCFYAEVVSGDLVLKEHEAAKWLTKEELNSVDWLPADISLIEKIKIGICGGDMAKKYYEAYDDRYKIAHAKGVSWLSDRSSPIVLNTIKKYRLDQKNSILEIGCGEGRDAKAVLDNGYKLLATDISEEAIAYCQKKMPSYKSSFEVLDCINGNHEGKYDFIYSIAVIHMFVLNDDRNAFYRFFYEHLTENGIALICTMGDGEEEMQSDISDAFKLFERNHESGKFMVTGTSCRKVSFTTFEQEITSNHLEIVEKGITSALPDFNSLMFAIVNKKMSV